MDQNVGTSGGAMNQSPLQLVREGMDVYDRSGDKVGTVSDVQLGVSSDQIEAGGAGSSPSGRRDGSLVDTIADVFAPDDDVPEVVRNRLRQHGFIRIGGGVFGSDRYAMGDQIASIRGDDVLLAIDGDELIEI